MLNKQKSQRYYPPVTPNWTGRTPRSSTEAFGYQWQAAGEAPVFTPARTKRSSLLLVFVVVAIVGGLCLA